MRSALWVIGILCWFSSGHASPCCGASFLVPNLVTNDQQGHLLLSTALSKEVQVVDSDGYWSKPTHPLVKQSFQISSAYRWKTLQAGITLPLLRNVVEESSSPLLFGDLGLSAGWTAWDHPVEIEKLIFFLQYQHPFGKSKFSTTNMLQVSSQGLPSISFGYFMIRTWGWIDMQNMLLLRRSFSKNVSINDENLLHQQMDSYAFLLGAGYSFGKARLGIAIQPVYEGEVRFGDFSTSSFQRHTDLSLHWNFFLSPQSSWTISYTDQTWIEAPISSYLSRSVGISFRYALLD